MIRAMVTPRAVLFASLAMLSACDESAPAAVDGSLPRDLPLAVDATCFAGTPRTRVEFLNRCTDAETASKVVALPLRRADGTLPPLP